VTLVFSTVVSRKMMHQVSEIYDLLDSAHINGSRVADCLKKRGTKDIQVRKIQGRSGSTDFVKILIPGQKGKRKRGKAPTLGIIGRLGGIGARPNSVGLVSDADGAVTALACALKLSLMIREGDFLSGDVVISTHICPNAPTRQHHPVPFMDSPVDMATMNQYEVDPEMDAILSVDTTKGNRIIKWRGFAITPTVKEGWILKVSDDLVTLMEWVTGSSARVVPLTMQDITPYGNGIDHINSIMQPAVASSAPVVGIAITSGVSVPGCVTGVSHIVDIEAAGRYCLEVAKAFTEGKCRFYDAEEFEKLKRLYGSMAHLQTFGKS